MNINEVIIDNEKKFAVFFDSESEARAALHFTESKRDAVNVMLSEAKLQEQRDQLEAFKIDAGLLLKAMHSDYCIRREVKSDAARYSAIVLEKVLHNAHRSVKIKKLGRSIRWSRSELKITLRAILVDYFKSTLSGLMYEEELSAQDKAAALSEYSKLHEHG